MAWVNYYNVYWASKNVTGVLSIQKDTSSAPDPTPVLTLIDESLIISYDSDGWESHILKMKCEFEIANQKDDWFDLLPLMTAEEKYWKIVVTTITPSVVTLFEGFLNCETVSQGYLKYQSIKFVASSYLSKLEYVTAPSIDTLQNMSFISIIDEILRSVGAEYNIRINCSLQPVGETFTSGDTLFTSCGFYTEVFWEDNVKRRPSLEILQSILLTFDCYLYWWNGYWYIDRYRDILQSAYYYNIVNYIEYQTGESYDIGESEDYVSINKGVLGDLQDLVFTGQSQILSTVPGMRYITINLDDKLLFNLVSSDMSIVPPVTGLYYVINPERKHWQRYNDGTAVWANTFGDPYYGINSSINRITPYADAPPNYPNGLYTNFIATVREDTTLLIKFKFASEKGSFGTWSGDWADYNFKFYWFLRVANYTTNRYVTRAGTTWDFVESTVPATYIQHEDIAGTEFDDMSCVVEVSISIPIGNIPSVGVEFPKLDGDFSFVLGICEELVEQTGETTIPCAKAWYGDVVVTATGDFQDNVIEGDANTSFINKFETTLDLFDMDSYNYRNGVLMQTGFLTRTTEWSENGDSITFTLVEWLMKALYQRYNVVRQQITGTVYNVATANPISFLRPFHYYYDSLQANKGFILIGYSYNVCRDSYDITLLEYDNATVIDLI